MEIGSSRPGGLLISLTGRGWVCYQTPMLFENTGSGHKAHLRSEIYPVAMDGV